MSVDAGHSSVYGAVPMPSLIDVESEVITLEGSLSQMRGKDLPLEAIGGFLGSARGLYVRQLDPNRICTETGQPWGPFVERAQVLPPLPPHLLFRLERIIKIAEQAFEGIHPHERALMQKGMARIPTEEEDENTFQCYSLPQE